jgi:hypothetical protein
MVYSRKISRELRSNLVLMEFASPYLYSLAFIMGGVS